MKKKLPELGNYGPVSHKDTAGEGLNRSCAWCLPLAAGHFYCFDTFSPLPSHSQCSCGPSRSLSLQPSCSFPILFLLSFFNLGQLRTQKDKSLCNRFYCIRNFRFKSFKNYESQSFPHKTRLHYKIWLNQWKPALTSLTSGRCKGRAVEQPALAGNIKVLSLGNFNPIIKPTKALLLFVITVCQKFQAGDETLSTSKIFKF